MTIIIDVPVEDVNDDKTIEGMAADLAQKGWVSSSALYLMTGRK